MDMFRMLGQMLGDAAVGVYVDQWLKTEGEINIRSRVSQDIRGFTADHVLHAAKALDNQAAAAGAVGQRETHAQTSLVLRILIEEAKKQGLV